MIKPTAKQLGFFRLLSQACWSENDKKKAQNLLANLGVIHFTDKKGKPSDSEGNPVEVTTKGVYNSLFL